MDSTAIQDAFSRHPRPQAPSVPTHSALLRKKFDSEPPNVPQNPPVAYIPPKVSSVKSTVLIREHTKNLSIPSLYSEVEAASNRDPWTGLERLGILTQGNLKLILCVTRHAPQVLRMLKVSCDSTALEEIRMIKKSAHPNVIRLLDAFSYGSDIYLELEYSRITLEDILSVSKRLEEPHVKFIAYSLFSALKHMCSQAILHRNITLRSVRIVDGMRIVLSSGSYDYNQLIADFDQAQECTGILPNTDFDDFGLLLLQCMDGEVDRLKRDVKSVREQRAANKVFGLRDPEPWSGSKQLVDFLDELFNQDKSVIMKIERPHPYIQDKGQPVDMSYFIELAMLECFSHWTPV